MDSGPAPVAGRSLLGGAKGLATLALLAAGGLAFSATTLAAFSATLLFLLLALRLWARLALFRVEAELRIEGRRVFPGEAFRLVAGLRNRKPLPVWLGLELVHPPGIAAGITEGFSGEAAVPAYGRAEGIWTYRAGKRGVYRLGPAGLSAGDLLGLFREARVLPFEGEVVVFPRKLTTLALDSPFRDFFGIHPSKGVIEDPAWYEGTRDYDGSRPARNIHWKASVRFGVLQEKIFAPTSHRKVFLVFEGAGFAEAEDGLGFELALELLASLASAIAESGASLALVTDRAVRGFPAHLPLGRGPEQLGAILELLARVSPRQGTPTRRLVAGGSPAGPAGGSGGAGFVVLAREAREGVASLRNLAPLRRYGRIVVHATRATETEEEGIRLLSFRELLPPEGEGL